MKSRIHGVFVLLIGFLVTPSRADLRPAAQPDSKIRINAARLERRIAELAEIGKNDQGGMDRVAFSQADVLARARIVELMRESGLSVRADEAGNIIGRREGSQAGLPAIMLGSHTDTVPNGGRYDGALGVLAAIECVQSLRDKTPGRGTPLRFVISRMRKGARSEAGPWSES